jgi:glycosyltransferase involved in cell wall biosynthesis
MKLLFVKRSLAWPRSSGHDVHTYYMMKACSALGHDVGLATAVEPTEAAVDGLTLSARFWLDAPRPANGLPPASWLQARYRSFYGMPPARIAALADAATSWRADAVIVAGLDALPYFPACSGVVRIWYAGDEWARHHLSQLKLRDPQLRTNLRDALVKALYERAHASVLDRVWVVSDAERRAMRWIAGVRHVDVLPNGVDGDFFAPGDESPEDRTAVFWGRLDFGPNIQALEWFFGRVWPLVRRAVPDARFTILGFQPSDAVRRLAAIDGVSLVSDLPDLRSTVRRHALVVLPFTSGGGIKNKLLEAAALGCPIVCTPVAAQGLRTPSAPLMLASSPDQMMRAMIDLWSSAAQRQQLGVTARAWVLEHHTWTATAQEAVERVRESLHGNGRP